MRRQCGAGERLARQRCGRSEGKPTTGSAIRGLCRRLTRTRLAPMIRAICHAGASSALALALGVGCGSSDELVPASCLPGKPLEGQVAPGDADVLGLYLDVSQSSTNFGRGEGESAYRDLIAWLLDLRSDFGVVRSYGFAERIAEIDEEVFVAAARGAVNPCRGCGFRESRLDDVLAALAVPESRSTLNVVVTDLWLDNSELIGSARVALQGPIRSILADGRAIGVLGVAAPYSGQVYDLPPGAAGPTIPAGRVRQRPVFALLVGFPSQVSALARRIIGEVLPDGGRAERHFTLFTPALAPDGPVEHRLAPRGPAVRRAYVLAIEDANVPGFLIDRRAIDPLVEDGAEAGPDLAAPISGTSGDVPSPAAYDISVETWTLVPPEPSAACDAEAWASLDVGRALQVTTGPGGPAVGLDVSHPDLLAIRSGEIAFVRYRVAVGALERGGAGMAWLDEWNFDAEDAPALVADPPQLFPVLNLAELGRLLAIAMGEQVTGETVAQGSVLLSVE